MFLDIMGLYFIPLWLAQVSISDHISNNGSIPDHLNRPGDIIIKVIVKFIIFLLYGKKKL